MTIKHTPLTEQRHTDGTVILQAQGSPGECFDIPASQDLLNWLDLGNVQADTNGLMQFNDTNAPNYPLPLLLHHSAMKSDSLPLGKNGVIISEVQLGCAYRLQTRREAAAQAERSL